MRSKFIGAALMTAASLFLLACDPAANTANKPANAANAANTAATNTTANHDADMKKLIGDLAAALSKNDTAALDKIYGDNYTLVTADGGVTTKAQRLEAMKSGDLKFENVVFDDITVRSYGDSAVAIVKSSGKSWNKGKEQTTSYRITFVANKTKDGWRMVSAHLTNLDAAASTTAANSSTTNTNKPPPPAAVPPANK